MKSTHSNPHVTVGFRGGIALVCLTLAASWAPPGLFAAPEWKLGERGGIEWTVRPAGLPWADHIEQSGKSVNAIIDWSLDVNGRLKLSRSIRWPMLRTLPDDTHASLAMIFVSDTEPLIGIQGQPAPPVQVKRVTINGIVTFHGTQGPLDFTRRFFASNELPAFLETFEWTNRSSAPVTVSQPRWVDEKTTDPDKGKWGAYRMRREWIGAATITLAPGECAQGALCTSAVKDGEPFPFPDVFAELAARESLRDRLFDTLTLRTPDPVLNRMFDFSKYRVVENILATRGGLMHAPGGRNKYLGAIWCNDQNEYANPFFGFVDDASARESARNAFSMYAKFVNPDFKPLPSSIIAEGRDIWNGARDRGDAAMTAYGAARWALATGDRNLAGEVWPLIEWCLEYTRRQLNEQGVPKSNTDELEGRFPAGKANLCTASLYHDALISSAALARDLGKPEQISASLLEQAANLKSGIVRHFSATVEGFQTFRYYDGNDVLRSWICIPLTCGILEQTDGTLKALFSDRLWTPNGLLTQSGTKTYWDRTTLYGLRAAFTAGDAENGLDHLTSYTRKRLLGDHVPYPIEAWPEQGQSHLAAESALYCRIFTEGVLGIRPTGLSQCTITPRLPAAWPGVTLSKIRSSGRLWNLSIGRDKENITVLVTDSAGGVIYQGNQAPGASHTVDF